MCASIDECLTVHFRDEIQVPGLGGKPTWTGAFQLDRDHQNAGGRQEDMKEFQCIQRRIFFLCYKVSHPTVFLFSAPTEAPRNVQVKQKSSTELEAIWEAPPIAHWNSEMLSYKIGYK